MKTTDELARLAERPVAAPLTPAERVAQVRRRIRRRQRAQVAMAATAAVILSGTLIGATVGFEGAGRRDTVVTATGAPAADADPNGVPRVPRSQLVADAPPGLATGGKVDRGDWKLVAISDDEKALLIDATVPTCSAYDGVTVQETADAVTVTYRLRSPGVKQVCISNTPHVANVRVVVQLATALGGRPLHIG